MALIKLERMVTEEENKIINVRAVDGSKHDCYSEVGYPKEVKENCLTMYVNANGFRAIERIKKVNHNTVIRWVREIGNRLPDSPESYQTPQVAQLDELQTFVGKKK